MCQAALEAVAQLPEGQQDLISLWHQWISKDL